MNQSQQDLIANLPGADMVRAGLKDYQDRKCTIPSCLVRMARRRLAAAGIMESSTQHDINAELDLYQLLSDEGTMAHSRYNALIRELISFEHALDHRLNHTHTKAITSFHR